MSEYATGADMWQDYKTRYGEAEARGICNRYLDMQVNNQDAGELQFCRELFAAMGADLPEQEQHQKPGSLEYGGNHFTPVRQFRKSEGDFHDITRRQFSDRTLGLSTYEWQKNPYSYADFYAASTDKECDIFRCEETGLLYVPGENELFGYNEPKQRSRNTKASVVGALEKARQERPAPATAQRPGPERKGGER